MKSIMSSVLCVVLLVILKHVDGLVLTATTTQSHPMEGYSTALTCDVQDMGDSQIIIWNKDQKFITWGNSMGHMMSSRFELVMNDRGDNVTTYTLNINDVTRDDDGRYQCQVLQGNDDGYSAVASESLILSVLYFPASIYPQCSVSGPLTLLTDSELSVSCMSEVGNPQISSVWTTEFSTLLQPVYRMDELPNMVVAQLDLYTTSDLDGAVYVCRVSSPAYPNLNQNCTLGPLRVIERPIVSVTRSIPSVAEGADIQFSCTTEPNMPNLKWVTYPRISADRLVLTGNGSVLTVKNVQIQDNSTYVVCQVPHKNSFEEAGSVILLDRSSIVPIIPTHPTSQLCLPWFGAFIFTAVVNVILCIIITSLLIKLKRLPSKLKHGESNRQIGSSGDTKDRKKKSSMVLTWPATSTNWAMTSEKLLRDQRRESWRSFPQPSDSDSSKGEATTYTPLTSSASLLKAQSHHATSLPILDKLDKSYVSPKLTRTLHERSTKTAEQRGVQSPVKSSKKTPVKTPTGGKHQSSKPNEAPKKSAIKTISTSALTQPPPQVGTTAYMDLNAKVPESSPGKVTYQPLRKTPNSSHTAQSATGKKSTRLVNDEMSDESSIYNGSSCMGFNQDAKSIQKQGSSMNDNPSYMLTGTIHSKDSGAQISKYRPGTATSKSSSDAYESTPPGSPVYSKGITDNDMGDAVYQKSLRTVTGGRNTKQGSSRATVSSRAPLPDPRAPRPAKREDSTSTDESYKVPYSPGKQQQANPDYFTLEPDSQYTNYGADISSECDSYQGGEAFDWDETAATGSKVGRKSPTASQASYLELEDVEGEVKGYMIMKKAGPTQLKTPSKFAKTTRKISDTDSSGGEYYEQMEEKKRYEYAIPPSNQLASVTKGADTDETVATKQDRSKKQSGSSEEQNKKKKGGWGIFRK
ncbi:uncharacterized protein [Asterias amurensis]|uniref:uncharacterized protein n=1 Tax=Asterias amurensis TaxID=7602 RepID=UPI003AB2C017